MKIEDFKLSNGISAVVVQVPDLEVISTNLTVATGARYEDPSIFGISHFLEHMLFKGTKKYPSTADFSSVIESIGGQQNAGTSKEYTTFWNKVPTAHAEVALDTLAEQVSRPLLLDKDINDERGVIIEEINLYADNPQSYIWKVFNEVLWPGQNAASNTLGPKENIQKFKSSDFKRYMNDHYVTDNMNICVAGGIEVAKAKEILEKVLKNVPTGPSKNPEPIVINQKSSVTKLFEKKTDQAHIVLAYKTHGRNHKNESALRVLANMLGGGMASVLFSEIREKRGLAYTIVAGLDILSDAGVCYIYAGLNKTKTEEAIKVIKEEIEKIKNGDFSKKDLTRAIEYARGKYLLKMDGTENLSSWFGVQSLTNPEGKSIAEKVEALGMVTREEVIMVAKDVFRTEVESLVVVGPFKNEEKFAKILTSGGIYV